MDVKRVPITTPYITLGQFLKLVGLIDNGGEAKIYLQCQSVFVNGKKENRRGRKLYPDFKIETNNLLFMIEDACK